MRKKKITKNQQYGQDSFLAMMTGKRMPKRELSPLERRQRKDRRLHAQYIREEAIRKHEASVAKGDGTDGWERTFDEPGRKSTRELRKVRTEMAKGRDLAIEEGVASARRAWDEQYAPHDLPSNQGTGG